MHKSRISLLKSSLLQLSLACLGLVASSTGFASTTAATPSAVVQQFAQPPRLAGHGQMRFLGLRIYDARLWVGPEFDANTFGNYPLVLELTYHRTFTGKAIAERSVQEIERQRALNPDLAQRWTAQLTQWLPDVKAGDKLTGVYLPGQGMRLWHGEQALGLIDEPDLARHFFGIWLSPKTSEPSLRSALLAGLKPSTP